MNHKIFSPSFDGITPPPHIPSEPFQYSTCSSADLYHPEYSLICKQIHREPIWHRKLWEWAYIVYHLKSAGMLHAGYKGVCFGVGNETLPAFFASMGPLVNQKVGYKLDNMSTPKKPCFIQT
jgi:hypothetical protein